MVCSTVKEFDIIIEYVVCTLSTVGLREVIKAIKRDIRTRGKESFFVVQTIA